MESQEPTYLNFKYQGETDEGEPIGAVWPSPKDDPWRGPGPPPTLIGYMTLTEAEAYAARRGYIFNEA